MISPIEQHAPALAYDSARQTMMPPPVVQAPPMAPVQDMPVQQSQPSREQSFSFDRQNGSGDLAFEQRSQAAIAQKMRAARSYLRQLQAEVSVAIAGGHVAAAKRISLEAADVASSIDSIARHIPLMQSGGGRGGGTFIPANLAGMANSGDGSPAAQPYISALTSPASGIADAAPSVSVPASPPTSAPVAVPSIGELMTMARGGLDIAQQVVVSASTLPFFSPQDSSAVNFSLEQVKAAIINVEAIMANISMGVASAAPQAPVGRVDVST